MQCSYESSLKPYLVTEKRNGLNRVFSVSVVKLEKAKVPSPKYGITDCEHAFIATIKLKYLQCTYINALSPYRISTHVKLRIMFPETSGEK